LTGGIAGQFVAIDFSDLSETPNITQDINDFILIGKWKFTFNASPASGNRRIIDYVFCHLSMTGALVNGTGDVELDVEQSSDDVTYSNITGITRTSAGYTDTSTYLNHGQITATTSDVYYIRLIVYRTVEDGTSKIKNKRLFMLMALPSGVTMTKVG